MYSVFLFVTYIAATKASNLKGVPIPGAIKLDQLLSRFLNRTDYTGAIFEYLRGEDNARRSDQLDMRVLDRDNVKKLLNNIFSNYKAQNYRRYTKLEAYYNNHESGFVKETALDMMKQSIYATKFRMNETRRFRKKYQNNPTFYIAMYYGALIQVNIKLETLYTIIKKLPARTHFLWFLVVYEKILAANVDAHDMVDRIFDLNDKYSRMVKGETGVVLAPTIPPTRGPEERTRRRRTRTRPVEVTRSTFKGEHDAANQPTEEVVEHVTMHGERPQGEMTEAIHEHPPPDHKDTTGQHDKDY